MTKKNIIVLVFLIFGFLGIPISTFAQSTYEIGILPSLTLTKKINPKWKISLNAQARFSTHKGEFADSETFQEDIDYILTDISILANRKVGLNSSFVGGYLHRLEGNQEYNRLFQQFIITKRYGSLGMAHRFATDQTFNAVEKTEFRLRYRVAFDRPLNGDKLNPNEFYLKLNNEYLVSLQDQEWSNEMRIIPFLGYAFTDTNKLEVGIDYRVGSFGERFLESNFWLSLNYYWSF